MKRNNFNLSHYKVGTCPFGKLVPISCFEVLPGDTVQMASSIFFRLSPMVNPSFAMLKAKWWHFFVPYRLLWDNWEVFRTGGPDGLDVSTPPTVKVEAGVGAGTVNDYLGVPVGFSDFHSLLPFRAYFRVFDEFFRDQDLKDPLAHDITADQTLTITSPTTGFSLLDYAWEKDYFTTARPWPAKGAEVTVPVNNPANTSLGIEGTLGFSTNYAGNMDRVGGVSVFQKQGEKSTTTFVGTGGSWASGTEPADAVKLNWDLSGLNVKSSSDGSIGNVRLDDLREAFALQRFEEARAMYGSRYTEYLRYLGVRSSDARLQRPEFLGGGRTTLQISEVLQTAADGTTPVGTLRGHGVGAGRSKRFRRFIEEDGVILTLMSIMPTTLYAQGLPKMFSRSVKEDFWTKELQHIGQQEVMTRELYGAADADDVFGYQNRYDDYRSVMSSVCGQMRPSQVDEDWTMARIFNNKPVLNASFVYGTPSMRNFAEQSYHPLYFMASNSVVAKRLMSRNGNPIL